MQGPYGQLLETLIQYQYILLYPLMIIEGPVVTMAAGFLSSLNYMNFWWAFLVAGLADVTGDLFYYSIGRGSIRFLPKWFLDKFKLTEERLRNIQTFYNDHGGKTLIISKVSHGFGWPFLVGAGASRMPLRQFLSFSILIAIPKTLILLGLGYYFGESFAVLSKRIGKTSLAVTTAIIVIAVIYLYHAKRRRGKDSRPL